MTIFQYLVFFLQKIINHIRANSHSAAYASSMSPPVAQQIYTSMKIIMGEDGTDRGNNRILLFHITYSTAVQFHKRPICTVSIQLNYPQIQILAFKYTLNQVCLLSNCTAGLSAMQNWSIDRLCRNNYIILFQTKKVNFMTIKASGQFFFTC